MEKTIRPLTKGELEKTPMGQAVLELAFVFGQLQNRVKKLEDKVRALQAE